LKTESVITIVLHCFVGAVFPHALGSMSSQAAQGGGSKTDPPRFFCVGITVAVTSFTGRVQPPQPPTNFYPDGT